MKTISKVIGPLDVFKRFMPLLEKSEECVAHEKKHAFFRQIESALLHSKFTLIKELLDDNSAIFKELEKALKKAEQYVDPGKSCEFELQTQLSLVNSKIDLLEMLSREAKSHPIEGWKELEKKWQALCEEANVLKRRIEILKPSNEQSFKATLRWMAQHGVEKDLEVLQRVKKESPYASQDIEKLVTKSEQQIGERLDDPDYVLRQGEEAYQHNKEAWDQKYAGQYIAIHRGKVIDSDLDKPRLIERVMKTQEEQGPFRAYIMAVGASGVAFRGPSHRLQSRRK